MQYKLGFIGCGNMGSALVRAAVKTLDGNQIAVYDRHEEKINRLRADCSVVEENAETIAKTAQFVVVGVKPQAMETALAPLAKILQSRDDVTVVTMAAGVSIDAVQAMVGKPLPVIRIMPNTPVTVGAGMVLYSVRNVTDEALSLFQRYFSQAGVLEKIPETQIDAGCALSGSGPAFAYAFAEGLIRGATECGVPEEKAAFYAAQTLKGAAEMLLAFGDPVTLRRAVCSPNGTTLAGVKALEDGEFWDTTKAAVVAAYRRALELKK